MQVFLTMIFNDEFRNGENSFISRKTLVMESASNFTLGTAQSDTLYSFRLYKFRSKLTGSIRCTWPFLSWEKSLSGTLRVPWISLSLEFQIAPMFSCVLCKADGLKFNTYSTKSIGLNLCNMTICVRTWNDYVPFSLPWKLNFMQQPVILAALNTRMLIFIYQFTLLFAPAVDVPWRIQLKWPNKPTRENNHGAMQRRTNDSP